MFLILAAAVAAAAWLLAPNREDPKINGLRLSRHLALAVSRDDSGTDSVHAQMRARDAAVQAVRTCGTNALPLLHDWLDESPPVYPDWFQNWLFKYPKLAERMLANRQALACAALANYPELIEGGSVARLMEPLAHCVTNRDSGVRISAIYALANVIAFSAPTASEAELIKRNALANISPHAKLPPPPAENAWTGPGDSSSLSHLADADEDHRAYLRLSRGSPKVRAAAAEHLARRKARPEIVIPRLTAQLSHAPQLREPCLRAIAMYGEAGAAALPALRDLASSVTGAYNPGAAGAYLPDLPDEKGLAEVIALIEASRSRR